MPESSPSDAAPVERAAATPAISEKIDVNLVTWDDNDPENPKNWSRLLRISIVMWLFGMAVCSFFAGAVLSSAIGPLMRKFSIGHEAATLPVTLTIVGWAMGPLVFSPASEIWGRNAIYFPTWTLFMAFNIATPFVNNYAGFLICRFIVGVMSSPIVAISAASAWDMFPVNEVSPYILLLTISAAFGSSLAGICGGYLVQSSDWRWTLWTPSIAGAVILLVCPWIPETHAATILERKARRLRKETAIPTLYTHHERHRLPKAVIFQTAIWRPLQLLVLQPIVLLVSLSHGFIWGTLYFYLGAYLLVFEQVYGFSEAQAGTAFVAMIIGNFGSLLIARPLGNTLYKRVSAKYGKGEVYPEARLPMAMIATVMMPISIFWFSWTTKASIHWIVPMLSGILFGLGQVLLFSSLIAYILDSFPHLAASVGAANSLIRLACAATFPLATTSLYKNVQINWATSIFGFIQLAFVPIPFLFFYCGPWLRRRSRFSPKYRT